MFFEVGEQHLFIYNDYFIRPVSNHFCSKGEGSKSVSTVEVTVYSKEKILKTFVPITSQNSAPVCSKIFHFGVNDAGG